MRSKLKKVLLYSGGVDSWLINKLWKPDVKLYININGDYSEEEIKFLPPDVNIINFPLGFFEDKITKYIPLRNLYFLMLASNYGEHLCLGATSGDYGAIDKRPEFFDHAQNIINYCLQKQSVSEGKKIIIEKNFVYKSKYELAQEYLTSGGTIQEIIDNTFSCFNPKDYSPCLNCKPCFRKFMLGYYFDYNYTLEEKNKMLNYIKNNVLKYHTGEGTYYKDRKGEGEYLEKSIKKLFNELGEKYEM